MARKSFIKALACVSALSLCFGAVGFLSDANVSAKADDEVTLVNGVTYQENYTDQDETKGVKFTLPVSNGVAKLDYWGTMTTAELAKGFTFKMTPADYTVAEATNAKIIIQDSVDSTQKLIIALAVGSNWWGNKRTYGFTSLADDVTFSGGNAYIAGTEQNCLGNYYEAGSTNDVQGAGPINGWQTGYDQGKNVFTTPKETHFQYADGVVSHAMLYTEKSYIISDLKNDTYQSKSVSKLDATTYADLIARYTDTYVDSLFSSGKVTLSFEFGNTVGEEVSFMLTNFGGTAMTTVATEGKPEAVPVEPEVEPVEPIEGVLPSGIKYTANYTDQDEVTGIKINVPVVDGTAKFQYWNTMTTEELASGFMLKMTPADYTVAEATNAKIIIQDSVDPSQKLIIALAVGSNWYGNKRTYGFTSLADDVTFSGGYAFIAGTEQNCLGNYYEAGSTNDVQGAGPINGWQAGYDQGKNVFTTPWEMHFWYTGGVVYHGDQPSCGDSFAISDLKNDTYQSKSVSNLDATAYADLIARYTDTYVDSLFSSGKVTLSFEFGNTTSDTVSFMLTKIGNSACTLEDKEAPVVSYQETQLDASKVYASVADIATDLSVSVADAFATDIEVTYALFNASGEAVTGENITVGSGYTLKVTATDPAQNSVEKSIVIETIPYFTVNFYDGDGNVFATVSVMKGTAATAPATDPTKTSTVEKEYTFSAWTQDFSNVTANLDVYPEFTESARKYTITWVNGELETETLVAYGEMPSNDVVPTKSSDEQYDYTFSGWSPEIVAVNGEATYTAQFTSSARKYTITWTIDGISTSEEYAYGETPAYADTPTKAATGEKVFTFSGWTPEIVSVTEDVEYVAVFTESVRMYSVSIQYDTAEAEVQDYEFGAEIDLAPQTIEGKTFVKWIINGNDSYTETQKYVVTGDSTIVAVYEVNSVTDSETSSGSGTIVLSGCFSSIGMIPVVGLSVACLAFFAKKRKEN